jgi:hypothetical protein
MGGVSCALKRVGPFAGTSFDFVETIHFHSLVKMKAFLLGTLLSASLQAASGAFRVFSSSERSSHASTFFLPSPLAGLFSHDHIIFHAGAYNCPATTCVAPGMQKVVRSTHLPESWVGRRAVDTCPIPFVSDLHDQYAHSISHLLIHMKTVTVRPRHRRFRETRRARHSLY